MQTPLPIQEEAQPPVPTARRGRHARRPPLAEIDSWELWQAWKRGDRKLAVPWIGLLVSFCVVLAGMYSFFYLSTSLSDDTAAQVVISLVFVAFLFALWRRISPRRGFALGVVAFMAAVSGGAFLVWLAVVRLSGGSVWVGIAGTLALGLGGLATGLPSLNAIAAQQEPKQNGEIVP